MPDEMILDAPIDLGAPETPAAAEPSSQETSTEPLERQQEGHEPVEGQQAAAPVAIFENGKLSAGAKQVLDKVKAENPALEKSIRDSLYTADRLQREFPGGIRAMKELQSEIERFGGKEAIQQTQQELEQWAGLDEKFTRADPAFVEDILATPQGTESLMRLAPTVMDKMQQLDPDGFNSYFGKIGAQWLQESGFALAMERLRDVIGDNPKAMEQWAKLAGFHNGVIQAGDKKSKFQGAAASSGTAANPREAELSQREAELQRREWTGSATAIRDEIVRSEFKRIANGATVSPDQRGAIAELLMSGLAREQRNDKHFSEALTRFAQTNDKRGFDRLVREWTAKKVPVILKGAFRVVVPAQSPKPGSPAAKPGAQPNPGSPAPQPLKAGAARVQGAPNPSEVDYRKTTMDMVQAGWAVLRDGRTVQWR